MAQTNQTKRKVRFTITPEQAAFKASRWPGFHRKFSTLVEKEHLKERVNNMDRRLQQLLTEKQQFFKWAEVSKIKICKLEELLMNQNRQIIQLQEKLGPESLKNTEQDQASPETPAPTMTWANVVKGLGKAKQPVIQRAFQASSETPAPTMTSANVVKAEEEVKQPVILTEDRSSQTETTTTNLADVMEAEDEVREQLRLREAEVSQLKLEKDGLIAMLQEAKTLQREPDHKENEDLKLQVKFLVDKNKSLEEENNKLQKDKQAVVEKTENLEGKIQLMDRDNIAHQQLNNQMKKYIKTLQTEKMELEGNYNRRFLQLEKRLSQESHKNQEIVKSLWSAQELIAIREKELHQITGINEKLSASLTKTEELLLEAGNEVEKKEKENQEIATSLQSAQEVIAIKDQEVQRITGIYENLAETLFKTEELLLESSNEVEEKEKENQELLKKQKETELWIQKKNKKTFSKFFRRTKDRQSNQKQTEEVIEERQEPQEEREEPQEEREEPQEEREEPQEQEKKAKKKKKSFWSWFKSNRKVEEAAGSSA